VTAWPVEVAAVELASFRTVALDLAALLASRVSTLEARLACPPSLAQAPALAWLAHL
jgi:hypothetical protein